MSQGNRASVLSSEKVNQAQEVFVKNLIMRCKTELNEELWQMPEMVGYYNESLPIAPVQATADDSLHLNLKKVVCSPDLPIAEYPPASAPANIPSPAASNENIQCQICGKVYTSKTAFQAHQRTHTKDTSDDPYRCNICSKTFAVPARLTRHYRTHTGEKPFRCEFCNKSFSVKENLSVHRRIHTKERPYKCEICAKAFEHSGKLHRHMRIHTGERPHKCTICSKTFIQSGQLVIHTRVHTGEKPYVCNVCQKGFTCSKQLKVHSRTHTGEKPYSCDICGKAFGYNHVLKLHQVAHYGEKVYKCTICNHTFNSKKSMEAHIKSHSENAPTAPTPPASSSSSESSCSSIASDKENKDTLPLTQETSYEPDFRYYICPRSPPAGYILPHLSAVGVDLLAAAATVTEGNQPVVLNIISKNPQVSTTLRHPAYFPGRLTTADDLRRRVEAVIDDMQTEEPLTPPVSPVTPDPELSLPPRKRSNMIKRSMEATTRDLMNSTSVRHSSVIQYARAS